MTFRDDYNRNGYVVVPDAVQHHTLQFVINDITKMMSNVKKNKENYIMSLSACAKLQSVQCMFMSYGISLFLEELGMKTLLIHSPVINLMTDTRIQDVYYGADAHQDWASIQGSLDMVTAWVPLCGIKDNYPIEVIPGSHKLGIFEGLEKDSVLKIECDESAFVPIECKSGDVVFLSGFTIHRTGKGDGERIAISQRFDNADDPTFIERGYPCAQKRVVDREIWWKPTVAEVREVYV